MFRAILFGAVAFGAIFLLGRPFGTVFNDMRRYDKLRAMSGDSSLLFEGFKELLGYIMRDEPGRLGAKGDVRAAQVDPQPARTAQNGDGGSLFDTVRKDVTRYATMRAM